MPRKSDRKLVVILFADIAGYTALMENNEAAALSTIQQFKTIIHDSIPRYNGQVIQYFGDGCLVSFESSTQGVQCALELQTFFNQGETIPVRIGMHLGEVLFEEGNAYGDGVNIASRVESISIPGSILISKVIRDQIKNKDGFDIQLLGSFNFKNIKEPMEVYAMKNDGLIVPDKRHITGKLKENSSIFKRRDVQISAVIINLLVVALLMGWLFKSINKDDGLIVTKGNKYVLSIGVDNNPNWRRLYNAKNDALGVVDVLKEYFGFQVISDPLINESASKKQILSSIDQAKDILKKDDQLLVFYAGHGYSHTNNSEEDPEGYIVPYDGPSEESNDPSGYIKISDFLKKISELPALHITTIFDACYAGFALDDQIVISRGSARNLKEASITTSRKVFSSADHDQQAADNGPIAEHSLFTGFLIEGLRTGQADNNADKIISMNEIAIFLERNIDSYVSSNQTPRYGSYQDDRGGEMLLEYDNSLIRSGTSINELIKKKEDEIYTVVPFRTSTGNSSFPELKTYFPEVVLESLSEFEKKKYKVIRPNLISMSDSMSTNFRTSEWLEEFESTKYFAGRYEVFGNEIVIKLSLHNSLDDQFIYSFPEIKGAIQNSQSVRELALEMKKRIMGFMGNNDQIMDRMTIPPDYEAFKELKRANDLLCEKREEAMKYINKAIEIDPGYFRAYLLKATSYVNCIPIRVGKALEEWQKFKDKKFDITDYEQERFSRLEDELIGNYEALVHPKYEVFKDYRTKSTFSEALWHAIMTKNISLAKEMIEIAESSDIDPDFKKMIFVYNNMIEHHLPHGESPTFYARFKVEKEIIEDDNFKFFFPSMVLFDCEDNCLVEIEKVLSDYDENRWWRYIMAGDILIFKNKLELAESFYRRGYEKLIEEESIRPSNEMEVNYKLNDFDKCVKLGNEHLNSWLESHNFSPVRYYILSKLKLNQGIENKDNLLEYFNKYENFPGFAFYYMATIKCNENKNGEALQLLRKALKHGVGFTPTRYNFDPNLKPMWDEPEFIAFTSPK